MVFLAVGSDPASQLRPRDRQPATASVTVSVQISAHSQESNFYGVVPAAAADFDLVKGSKDQEIWRDDKCHHERGFPKITVIGIEGAVQTDNRNILLLRATVSSVSFYLATKSWPQGRRQ